MENTSSIPQDFVVDFDDYDSPWKEAVERYLPEFMAFYFAKAYAQIDWARGYEFLDQELHAVVQDAELGKRFVDKLVRVNCLSGEEDWIYIHLEVQGTRQAEFAGREDELLANENPFALVTLAHLLTKSTRKDMDARYAAKWKLVQLLYQRDWDKQRIIDLFLVLDWMMRLPGHLKQELCHNIELLEESEKMRYVSSVEQIGIEKGIAQGIQQGMQLGRHEGIQEGMQQGMQKGKHQGEEVLLRRLLTRRFGILPEAIETRLAKADINQLEIWGDRVLDAKSLNEVFQEH
jgi:hypothetical protein